MPFHRRLIRKVGRVLNTRGQGAVVVKAAKKGRRRRAAGKSLAGRLPRRKRVRRVKK